MLQELNVDAYGRLESKATGCVDVLVNSREKAESELMMLVVTAHLCYTGSGEALGRVEPVASKDLQ